jgi:hypothetical protein
MTGPPSELLTPAGNVTYIALVDLITFREGDYRTFDLFHIYDPYSNYTVLLALQSVPAGTQVPGMKQGEQV